MEILYKCSICGFTDPFKENVEDCEKNHCKITDLNISEIFFHKQEKIPFMIQVITDDNRIITFSRKI